MQEETMTIEFSPEKPLSSKVALITGAARGLGFAMAKAAGEAGARVVLNDRNPDELERSVEALKNLAIEARAAPFDVTSEKQVVASVEQILAETGQIDILVNNAGNQLRKPFVDYTLAEWNSILDVHLTGTFLTTRSVAPNMIARKTGAIILMGSVAVQSVRGTISPYVAAKGALTALGRALATEFAPHGVRCNVIAPGFFETEFNRALLDNSEFFKRMTDRVPLNRWGAPEDLAPTMVFLASDAARYITGQTLAIDGGILAAL
jgi:gluconate 5-dehydrogenase